MARKESSLVIGWNQYRLKHWSSMSKKIFVTKKRPVDKNITSVDLSLTTTLQSLTLMVAGADAVRTFNGGIFSGSFSINITGANGYAAAFLVLVKDGDSINAIDLTNAVQTYKPEENVLWGRAWGYTGTPSGTPNPDSLHFVDTIKTKRKLFSGDALHLICVSQVAIIGRLRGIFTHFYKI